MPRHPAGPPRVRTDRVIPIEEARRKKFHRRRG
jgi:hypothetical protein